MPIKKKLKRKIKKNLKQKQKQSQTQVVNIRLGDVKKKQKRRRRVKRSERPQIQTQISNLGSALNMGVYSDLSRLNTLEILINKIAIPNKELITQLPQTPAQQTQAQQTEDIITDDRQSRQKKQENIRIGREKWVEKKQNLLNKINDISALGTEKWAEKKQNLLNKINYISALYDEQQPLFNEPVVSDFLGQENLKPDNLKRLSSVSSLSDSDTDTERTIPVSRPNYTSGDETLATIKEEWISPTRSVSGFEDF